MKKHLLILSATFLILPLSDACMSTKGKSTWSPSKIKKSFRDSSRKPAAVTPRFAEDASSPIPETLLGNLMLELKQEFPAGFTVSLPVRLERSDFHPFDDPQTNSRMSFQPHWKEVSFPVIGIQQTVAGGKKERIYRFHSSMNIKNYKESDLGNGWFKVQPQGWLDSFYFSYDTSTMPVSQFIAGIPEKLRSFPGNRMAPNPGRVNPGSGVAKMSKDLGAGYNKDPWPAANVHGLFPNANGSKTAIGGVLTWGIVNNSQGPFKHLYTCFEGRNLSEESKTGVPSGAGWHHIGDAGETLLNTLETAEIPVAVGRSHNNNDSAYKLTETVTATWLKPEEALVSLQGTFHWYLNPSEAAVCTEIWVHNCVSDLTNNWGFNCPWKQ